jgi:hypothetical protein
MSVESEVPLILSEAPGVGDYEEPDIANFGRLENVDFGVPIRLPDLPATPEIVVRDHSVPSYFQTGPLDVISEELKGLLEDAGVGEGVQFFPANIRLKGKRRLKSFVLHVVATVDCIDRERSVVRLDRTGAIVDVTSVVFRAVPLDGPLVFQPARCYFPFICVMPPLARVIESRFLDLRFIRAEDYPP